MSYLRIRNFWKYQNSDAWKKARQNKNGHRHPAWCKLYVAKDMELDAEPPIVRLVFYELLRLATVHANAISNDSQLIANAISLPSKDVAQAIDRLLEGAWLSQTKSNRHSREPSRKFLAQIEIEIEKKKDIRERPRDEVWDALDAELGPVATASERGRRNKAVKELKAIAASAEEVRKRCAAYRRLWPEITLTATALAANWSALEQVAPKPAIPVAEVVDLPNISEAERIANLERLAALTNGLRDVG